MDFYYLQALTSRRVKYIMAAHSLTHTLGFFFFTFEKINVQNGTRHKGNPAYIWLWQSFKPRNIPADQCRFLRTKFNVFSHITTMTN